MSRIHETAVVELGACVFPGACVWHHSHVRNGALVGHYASIGKNCYVEGKVLDYARVQNNVSVYAGVTIGEHAFVGPSVVFTNDKAPRANALEWHLEETVVRYRASIGANATIVCGVTIGEYAMVAAGSVVTTDVAPHALVKGNPARQVGWVCRAGHTMKKRSWHRYECEQCKEILHVRLELELSDGSAVVHPPAVDHVEGRTPEPCS